MALKSSFHLHMMAVCCLDMYSAL